MFFSKHWLVGSLFTIASLGLAQTPPPAPSTSTQAPSDQATTPTATSGYWSAVKTSALVDGVFTHNFNDPASRLNYLHNFAVRSNHADLNYAEFVVEHDAAPFGFRFDIGAGRTTKLVHGAEQGGRAFQYIQQAYVSYKPTGGRGFQADFGKFVTTAGAEVIETHSNWNYSRSLLFAWAIPYYHLGLRTSMPLGKNYTAGVQILNGWNNVSDNNSGKTVGLTGALNAGKVQWFHNYYVGPEKPDTSEGKRQLFDTTVLVTANSKTQFYVNFDLGNDRRIGEGSDRWYGVAAAARYAITDKLAITPRLEWFKDRDGFATGTPQSLKEFTLTGEFKIAHSNGHAALLSRVEYRRDWSDQSVFERASGLPNSKHQNVFLVGLVGYWESKR